MTTLLLDEPYSGGHQPTLLRCLVDGWARRGSPGRLVVSAPPPVLGDLAEAVEASGAVAAPRPPEPTGRTERLRRIRPLRQQCERHRPDRVFAMSFEAIASAWALRQRLPGRPALSALAFHTGSDRPAHWLRDAALSAALRHPDLDLLCTLDPTALPRLRAMGARRVVHAPDPVPPTPPTPPARETRAAWGVEAGRVLAVLTGSLDGRKGLVVLLDALRRLAPERAARLAVVVAGRIGGPTREQALAGIAAVRAEGAVQLVVRDGFASDADLAALTEAADVVLLPYPAQVGSSGFLMRAAGAGTPVLAPEARLMGWLTRTYGLGQTADTTDPAAVAAALARAIDDPRAGYRPADAAAFAEAYSPEAFADAILDPIYAS